MRTVKTIARKSLMDRVRNSELQKQINSISDIVRWVRARRRNNLSLLHWNNQQDRNRTEWSALLETIFFKVEDPSEDLLKYSEIIGSRYRRNKKNRNFPD